MEMENELNIENISIWNLQSVPHTYRLHVWPTMEMENWKGIL